MEIRDPLSADDLGVVISELLVATADSSDPLVDGSVQEVLKLLRQRLGMDVVFVSEFVAGQRMFRFVDAAADGPALQAGDANPLEESVCQRIVDGRLPEAIPDVGALPPAQLPALPFPVGAHLSTPIVMPDGSAYGTLCCFSAAPNPGLRHEDLRNLRACAALVARKLDLARAQGLREPPPEWRLLPMEGENANVYESKVWTTPSVRHRAG
jgi:hypothetical protein